MNAIDKPIVTDQDEFFEDEEGVCLDECVSVLDNHGKSIALEIPDDMEDEQDAEHDTTR